jgi:hypothetical protein
MGNPLLYVKGEKSYKKNSRGQYGLLFCTDKSRMWEGEGTKWRAVTDGHFILRAANGEL